MAKVSITPGEGADIATTEVSRDGGTEELQLIILADPVTAIGQSVTAPGASGAAAAAVQGVTGGVALPVSGTVTIGGTVTVAETASDVATAAEGIVANAGAPTTVKGTGGMLVVVTVTATGSGPLVFYNNATGGATGLVLGTVPANAAVGEIFRFTMPASVGISCPIQANNPAVTVGYN